MSDLRDLVTLLVEDDPWERSREGLDDGCHFCGCHIDKRVGSYEWQPFHYFDCAWLAARTVVGLDFMGHGILDPEQTAKERDRSWVKVGLGDAIDVLLATVRDAAKRTEEK